MRLSLIAAIEAAVATILFVLGGVFIHKSLYVFAVLGGISFIVYLIDYLRTKLY